MTKAPKSQFELLDMKTLQQAAECLKILAHPHRLRIIQMLLHDQYTVGELAQACHIRSHMASEHLRLMQRCGFLTSKREGRFIYYQVVEPHLQDILACIQDRFGKTNPIPIVNSEQIEE